MIKKLLAFSLLLAGGFFVLYAVIGADSFAKFGEKTHIPKRQQQVEQPAVAIPAGGHSRAIAQDVSVSYHGEAHIQSRHTVVLEDGSELSLPTYVLNADNMQPQPDGTWELRGLNVEFYETSDENPPRAVLAGKLIAARAYVVLGTDEEGRQSIAKDKDIDLFDALLTSEPDARVKNVRLEIDRARVRITDDAVFLVTPTADQDFNLSIHDRSEITMTGLGLDVALPLSAVDGNDERPANSLTKLSVKIFSNPVLTQRDERYSSKLTATGALTYVEALGNGFGQIHARDDIVIIGSERGATETFTALGDDLVATLQRDRDGGDNSARWGRIVLVGTPAQLQRGDLELTCAELSAHPNSEGNPYLFTASGEPKLTGTIDGKQMKFSAADQIHMVRLQEHWQPLLGGFGFTPAAFSRQLSELLIFRGASAAEMPQEGTTMSLSAAGGLRVLRAATGDTMTVRGLGAVSVSTSDEEQPLSVTGNNGFLLQADELQQSVILGPRTADPRHVFDIKTAQLEVSGRGACRLTRPADESKPAHVTLDSPTSDLRLVMAEAMGSLRQVAHLEAAFDQHGVRHFDARGTACQIDWRYEDRVIDGVAARVWGDDPSAVHLEGSPATINAEGIGDIRGAKILLAQLAKDAAFMTAEGDARITVRELPGDDQRRFEGAIQLDADWLALHPSALPWPALALQRRGLGVAAEPLLAGLDAPHLFARGNVVVTQFDVDDNQVSVAHGDRMALRLAEDSPVGKLEGLPATAQHLDRSGQQLLAQAPELRFAAGEGAERMSLRARDGEWPTVRLRDRQGEFARFGQAGGETVLVCHGDVEVAPAEIDYRGPVQVTSFDAAGSPDAQGLQMYAQSLLMKRNVETGDLEDVRARHDVEFSWHGITAKTDELRIDLTAHLCHVVSHDNPSVVTLPNGFSGHCARAIFNYETYEGAAWHTLVTQDRGYP